MSPASFSQEIQKQELPTFTTPVCDFHSPAICATALTRDQAGILSGPFHMHRKDWIWAAPLAAALGTAYVFDRKAMDQVSTNQSVVSNYRQVSNFNGIYLPVAGFGAALLGGTIKHDDHLRETAYVTGEALIDTFLVTTMLKYSTDRVRPTATGFAPESAEFWGNGKYSINSDSFPSGHTANAFAFAHVIADEYPGWKTSLIVYSLAAATGWERLGGRAHFPSDVLAGGAIGYLIGGYTYNHHALFGKKRLSLSPSVGANGFGVSVQFSSSKDTGNLR